jgi:predicted RNA binding protein YcfA (HicA-like mRNA interferase family)
VSKLPSISGRDCAKALENVGFYEKRRQSSHIILRRDEPFTQVVVPDHEDHHPNASEVFLLIEIADSSLKYDREVKAIASPTPRANAYSKSGIIEYWILDVNGRKLYMYRLPTPDGYHSESILAEDVTISPLAFPDCA